MIVINKKLANEPKSWYDHRNTPNAKYEATRDLREALLNEQGHLCAYCMSRISIADPNRTEKTRIEHIESRENNEDEELKYSNMVLCCSGLTGGEEHCDRSKGSNEITLRPFDHRLAESISYSSKDGNIQSSVETWDKEIEEILKLNSALLRLNRLEVLKLAIKMLANQDNNWNKNLIDKTIAEWSEFDQNGRLKPFCGIVIWYLKKKLKQL